MPWHVEAMKDAHTCDKLRGAGQASFDPEISEWGNPDLEVILNTLVAEYIG